MSQETIEYGIRINEETFVVENYHVALDWTQVNGEGEVVQRTVKVGPWETQAEVAESNCFCYRCKCSTADRLESDNLFRFSIFVVCDTCGNKRCPRATWHEYECTSSNDLGQKGSRYE